jgi:hypothetical protein
MFDDKEFDNKIFGDRKFDDRTFDDKGDSGADGALYAGLRDLPTPETSADFETSILAALAPRPPLWQTLWRGILRPALPVACCTLVAMLLLLRQAQQIGGVASQPEVIAREAARRLPSIEARRDVPPDSSLESMDNIDLNSASLSFLSHPIRRIPGKRG